MAARAGGDRGRKLKLPGEQVAIVDTDQVVQRATNVSAEADVVVANGVRPVVHPLILALYLVVFLGRGSIGDGIATIHSVCRDKDFKLRQPTGECQVSLVHTGYAERSAQRLVVIRPLLVEGKAEETEAKVSQPPGIQRVVTTTGDALVECVVGSGKASQPKAWPSGSSKNGSAIESWN